MRSIRFRTRIFLYFLLVLLPAICVPAYYLYHTLDTEIYKEAESSAFTQLGFLEWLLKQHSEFQDHQALDRWCTRVGEKLDLRITIINAGGRVIADSGVSYENVPEMENHITREEVMAARKQGMASSIRYSETVRRKLIYAAMPIDLADAPGGILRVAIPLSMVEERLAYFADRFWLVLALAFLLTALITYLLAGYLEAPIQRIIQTTRAIGEGHYDERLEPGGSLEFQQLSVHINDMADRIGQDIKTLTEQKREIEAVFEGMQEGVMLLAPNGRITSVNTALTRIAKCVTPCIGQRPIEVFINSDIQNACNEILNGKPDARLRVDVEQDAIFEINLVGIPEGGAVAVFHDISEQVRLEKARQDFVANVSHELRTPLTSIKGYAETLLEPDPPPEDMARSFLQTIVKNANQMANIVNDLLELTQLQQKSRGSAQLKPIDAALCLKNTWETFLPMAGETQIKLDNRIEGPLYVKAEENLLMQVFRNLLDNAIRYSPPDTVITAAAATRDGTCTFCIEDQGPGIPKRHQNRIFERFYRVDKERSRASGGTGLGLAICRHAVKGMGGSIWVESPPMGKTRGTAFYFSLAISAAPGKSDSRQNGPASGKA